FFFSSRRRHTRFSRDWSSDVCSSDLKLGLNIRYPIRGNGEDIRKAVAERVRPYGLEIGETDHKPPHYIDPEHPLVQTLSRVYEERTGEKASLLAIGGGTYARARKNGVAFGPLLPG